MNIHFISYYRDFACTRYLVKGAKYYIELLTHDLSSGDHQYVKVLEPDDEKMHAIGYEDLELPANY